MRYLLLLVLLCSSLVGQTPGKSTVILAGSLSCAARMYRPTQLQIWCFTDAALKVVGVNCLIDVSTTGFMLDTGDTFNADTGTFLLWMFLSDGASPPKISYQATVTKALVSGPILTGVL
jgi:hypothetical protein